MSDYDGPPRRVSMSYILGFSSKPYKDPKLPPTERVPHASLGQLVTNLHRDIAWPLCL